MINARSLAACGCVLMLAVNFLITEKVFAEDRQKSAAALSLFEQGNEAWKTGNYREALRLYREEQAAVDGPAIQVAISKAEAAIFWGDARSSVDYRHAIAKYPGAFSQDNLRYVEGLEAYEKQIAQHAEARYNTSRTGGADPVEADKRSK